MKRFPWGKVFLGGLLVAALIGLWYFDRSGQATLQFGQGRVAYEARNWQAAADAFSEAIRVAPPFYSQRVQAYWWRGNARIHLKDYAGAIDDYTEVIRLDPADATAYRNRGTAYRHLNQFDEALADLDEAIRLSPADAVAATARGAVYYQKGDFDRALADFEEAIRLNPRSAAAYQGRSLTHTKKGNDGQAKADMQKAIEIDPSLDKSKVGPP